MTLSDSTDIRSKLTDFQLFCAKNNIPLKILTKPSELPAIIDYYKPDFCLLVGWYWILRPQLLNKLPYGFFGIHASLLPHYRGGSPLVWSMINGDSENGVTLFQFDTGIDTGNIIAQKSFSIGDEESIGDILAKADSVVLELLEENYPLLIQGSAQRRQQDHSQATYCGIRNPENGHIDWNTSSAQVYNFIRAQTYPYPGAFCFQETNGQKLTLWKARIFSRPYYGVPGTVYQQVEDGVIIACGTGAVVAIQIQPEEQQPMQTKQVLRYGDRLK